jgi:hypothetical protein
VKVPAGTIGKVDVTLTNPDGQSNTLTEGFEYVKPAAKPAPIIQSVDPATGLEAGGYVIAINGANFISGATVMIGGKNATINSFVGSTQIRVKVPAGTIGKVDVTLTNPDGQSNTLTEGFEYVKPPAKPAPVINNIDPATGLEAGGYVAVINGANFISGATAMIGGKNAPIYSFVDSTKIRVTVPKGTAGKADVVLTNPDGQSVTLKEGFEYVKPAAKPAPVINSLTPGTGLETGGYMIVISGANFISGATVMIGGNSAPIYSFVDSTKIRVTVPKGTVGKADIVLTNPDGQSVTLSGGFEYMPLKPSIISLDPATGYEAGGYAVAINGTNFVDGAKVTIGGKDATETSFVSSTRIRGTVPAGTLGKADVVVTNPNGESFVLAGGFEYVQEVKLPPEIKSISPATGLEAGGYLIVIDGANFKQGVTVEIGGKNAPIYTFVDSTKIRVKAPAGTLGKADVVVTNPDGQSVTLTEGFEYVKAAAKPAPVIKTLSPATGSVAGGYNTVIDGANFISGATVTIGGKNAPVYTFVSSTRIRVKVPAGTIGNADVVLTNPDEQTVSLTNGFTYI